MFSDPLALVTAITNVLDGGKAEEILVVDLAGRTTIADYMIVASGRSERQVSTLAKKLILTLKSLGHGSPGVEGMPKADWVLIDAGDVVVHLFRPSVRALFKLEKMWTAPLNGNGIDATANRALRA